jgi:hypothetical protein
MVRMRIVAPLVYAHHIFGFKGAYEKSFGGHAHSRFGWSFNFKVVACF